MHRDPAKLNYRGRVGEAALARDHSGFLAEMAERDGSRNTADLVQQLRRRARAARAGSWWVLALLILTVLLGLGYYLVLPFIRDSFAGQRTAQEQRLQVLEAEQAGLDTRRRGLYPRLQTALRQVSTVLDPGTGERDLRHRAVLGDTLVIYGGEGALTRSTDGGESFASVDPGT
ncbi:MAG: hypothetical protein GY717_17120, partial [Rhodobacteraceae bacterium]|nr:hypothetical protein [Paracoccaceae bacterium]